jgi:hypothetical protein
MAAAIAAWRSPRLARRAVGVLIETVSSIASSQPDKCITALCKIHHCTMYCLGLFGEASRRYRKIDESMIGDGQP